MSVPLSLTFVSTGAFAIQFLIFVYRYSSHRGRFFRYLLCAWGAYTLSKGPNVVGALVPDLAYPTTWFIAVATIANASRACGIDGYVAVDRTVPRFAFDRDQVIQVLRDVARSGVQAARGRGRLSLRIPPEAPRRVSEPFYSGTPNGSELGLTSAQRIAGAHDSQPGHGPRVTRLAWVNGR